MLKCFHTLSAQASSTLNFHLELETKQIMKCRRQAHVYIHIHIYIKYNINNLACRLFSFYVWQAQREIIRTKYPNMSMSISIIMLTLLCLRLRSTLQESSLIHSHTHTHSHSRHAWFLPRAQKYSILCGVYAPDWRQAKQKGHKGRRRRHFSLKPSNWWNPFHTSVYTLARYLSQSLRQQMLM